MSRLFAGHHLMKRAKPLLRYTLGLLFAGLVLLGTWALQRMGAGVLLSLPTAAVAVIAWVVGGGPALLAATLMAVVIGGFIEPPGALSSDQHELVRLVGYLLSSYVVVAVVAFIGQASKALAAAKARADQALTEEFALREQIRTIAANLPEVMVRFDPQLRHSFINDYGDQVVPPYQLAGKSEQDRGLPSGMMAFWKEHVATVFALGKEEAVEFECDGPAGERQYFTSLFIPERDEHGEIRSTLAITRDVSAQRRAEEALRRSELKFRTSFEQAAVGMGRLSFHDWRWVDVNQAFCRMLGRTREEVLSTPCPEMSVADDVDLDRMAKGELDSYEVEKRFIHKDGHPVWARLTLSLVRDEKGRPDAESAIIVIGVDISDLKRAQEEQQRLLQALREADEQKNTFLAVLSHELRNSITPVRNSVYILDRIATGRPQAERPLGIIDRQVSHMSRMIDDLLDLTRISRGRIGLRREQVDLGEVVRAAGEDFRELFRSKDINFELGISDRPLPVRADRTRVTQVLANLLYNASKFTPAGGTVRLSVAAEADNQAVIRVRDDGAGMDPRLVDHLFEPFMQAESTLEHSRSGLGLGLALVKGLVALHGGSVSAHSDGPGRGSEFVARFPLEALAADRVPAPGEAAAVNPSPPLRVLLIEDNEDAAESLKVALELVGHQVDVANNGLDGLAKARTFHPDVVLCDIMLPGIDGFEVARRMRADPGLNHLPSLLAVSGHPGPEVVEKSREAGFEQYLPKPLDIDVLETVLRRTVAHGLQN